MQSDLAEALRERRMVLRRERDALAGEIALLQTRLSSVAGELTRVDALLDLYEPESRGPANGREGAATRNSEAAVPLAPQATSLGSASPAAGGAEPERRVAQPTAMPAPPEGAWKGEALRLLEEHGAPMHYKDLYRSLAAHGFTFGGRNPEAVLLTGVSREKETFVALGKGCYWIMGRKVPSGARVQTPRSATRARRPRPIGRSQGRAS
jgi:hypothetical protein